MVRLSLAAPAIIDEILSEISPELGLPVSSNQMFNALGTGRHRTGHDNSDLHDPEMLRLFSSMLGAEST